MRKEIIKGVIPLPLRRPSHPFEEVPEIALSQVHHTILDQGAPLCFYAKMRTTIDIQDAIFRRAKSVAATKGLSLKAFINSAVIHEMERLEHPAEHSAARVEFPIVPSNRPGKTKLTTDRIHELLEEEDLDALS